MPFRHSGLLAGARQDTFGRPIIWLAASLIVLSGCSVAAALFYLRGQALQSGQRLTQSLAQVIEEQTSRTFQTADQRLLLTAGRLMALQAQNPLDEDSARTLLKAQLQQLPFIRALWVLDKSGHIVFDSDVGNTGVLLADREYFQVYQQHPATEFHLSAPVRSRSTGAWLISASRPLRSARGEFMGVLVAAVQPSYFDQLWHGIDLGPGGAITLLRRDGVLMMRSPMDDALMGKSYAELPLFTRYLAQKPMGDYQATSAMDGRFRLNAYRTLSTYPELVVNVGSSPDDLLEPWARFARLSALIWLAGAVTVSLLSTLLYRYARQRQRTELRFRQLAQAMPQIVFIADPRGRVQFISEQWQETTGLPSEAALGTGWTSRIHPDDRERTLQDLRRTLQTGESKPNEHRLLCRDGVYRWQLARATPNRDSSGRIVSWYGTSTDINDLKQAEISLRAQADLLRMAGQLSRLGGWSLELSGMRFVWSDEASAILDLPEGIEPTLDTAITYCAPQWQDMARRVARECIEHGTPFDVELEMFTPSGRSLWVRSMARAIRGSDGTITRMQGALQDITERKLADQALLESEQRHAALFDAAPVPMWVMDANSHLHMAVNETAIRLYGYSREELATMTPVDLRPPGAEQQRMQTLLATGLPMNQPEQWVHRRKDGSEFPVELVRRMIRYDGRDAVFAVAIDVTARVRAEKEIQAYLETLQRAAEAAQRITQQHTPAAVLQEVADQARAIVGAHQAVVVLYHPEQAGESAAALSLSDKYASYRRPADRPGAGGIAALMRETRQAVRLTQAELEAHPRWRGIADPAGQHPPMRGWLAVPLTAHDGAAIGLLQLSDKYTGEFTQQDEYVATELAGLAAAAVDNARLLEQVRELNSGLEEKIAQRTQELTRQEALFRTLAEQAPQPIWTIDPQGAATFFSSAWYQLAGGAPPDWHGHAWVALVHPDDVAEMTRNWLHATEHRSLHAGLRRLRAQDGSYHTMSYRASPVCNENGDVTFWVGIDVDVTETQATEAALRLSNAELEAFSYSVSHDLRSPLNTVDGFSQLLARELGAGHGEKVQHYLARIQAGASQMGQLIEGLLSLAQVARTELHHAPVDLSLLAQEILERLHAGEPARKVNCRVEPLLLVQGDPRLLRSVMENLLGNAWKFSARKDVADIAVGRLAPHGAFFVRDNGAGFDMAHIGKLFGTFQRLHDARDYAGTGVGLATVARIIARHGGRIWAESALGEGATFYFTLPDTDA